jgi:7-cyano-7-deazaguanine synthase
MSKAVVLLSGGLDSATVLAVASVSCGFECYAMSFDYGQRHVVELDAAKQVAKKLGAREHRVVKVDLSWTRSALTDREIDVPKGITSTDIPVTYVPARNTIFLAYALAWAEVLEAKYIFAGMNALDYSGYPDCRPEYIAAFQEMARLGTRPRKRDERVEICAPLVRMTKADIVKEGARLGVPFEITSSCYDPMAGLACGHCDSCRLRMKGFNEANLPDPTRYAP